VGGGNNIMEQQVILTEGEINHIKSYPQQIKEGFDKDNPWFDSRLHNNESGAYSPTIRKSLEIPLDNKFIEPILLPHLLKYNIKSITGQVIMLQYNKGHYFKRHRDRINHDPHTSSRMQTLIIQLSDISDYEGGELLVRDKTANKTKGNMVIFDSNELHECTTITSGTRYCLVTWLSANDYKKNVSLM
tara:strand:+ start:2316 stop:2879 length:564 start_codon:yes stop_codon:yes gene_type:complete